MYTCQKQNLNFFLNSSAFLHKTMLFSRVSVWNSIFKADAFTKRQVLNGWNGLTFTTAFAHFYGSQTRLPQRWEVPAVISPISAMQKSLP
jgi:hypothetical protein